MMTRFARRSDDDLSTPRRGRGFGIHYDTDPLIVGTSGRYEFKNKGLDVFVDSLIQLADGPAAALKRPVLAYITVPAGTMVAARSGSGNVRVSGVNKAVKSPCRRFPAASLS